MKIHILRELFFISLLLFTNNAISQGPPPPEDTPTEENMPLVQEIIKITQYEKFYNDYCRKRINQKAIEEDWSEERKKKVLSYVDFDSYKSTIENAFAQYSHEQLSTYLNGIKELNKNKLGGDFIVPTTWITLSNLELHVNGLLKIE